MTVQGILVPRADEPKWYSLPRSGRNMILNEIDQLLSFYSVLIAALSSYVMVELALWNGWPNKWAPTPLVASNWAVLLSCERLLSSVYSQHLYDTSQRCSFLLNCFSSYMCVLQDCIFLYPQFLNTQPDFYYFQLLFSPVHALPGL